MKNLNANEKVLVIVLIFIFYVFLNLAIYATIGVVVAYFWNNMLLPSVDLTLPVISWWQAAIGLWLVKVLKNVIFGK